MLLKSFNSIISGYVPSLSREGQQDESKQFHETQKEYDHLRELMLTELEYTIIRFSNSEIIDNLPQVIEKIKNALNKLQ